MDHQQDDEASPLNSRGSAREKREIGDGATIHIADIARRAAACARLGFGGERQEYKEGNEGG